jgi:Gluconate 2-dehydrogenase subunit 3
MSEGIGTIGRRQAIQRLGASAVVPLLSGFHPSVPRQESDWKPGFFQDSEVETVAAISERILPETDTPGARAALVHQYIDFVLSRAEAESRIRFREGLVWLDRRCTALLGKPFAELETARQDEFLTGILENAFFHEIKRLTVEGYYRSEAGMRQELGFEGNTFLAEFEGCKHPEHHSWKPGD